MQTTRGAEWGKGLALGARILRIETDIAELRAARCYEAADAKEEELELETTALACLISDLVHDEEYERGVPGRACRHCNTAWPAIESEPDAARWHHDASCPLFAVAS